MCTGGRCGACELVGGGSGLFVVGATGSTSGGSFGWVGSTAGCLYLLFLVHLGPKLE